MDLSVIPVHERLYYDEWRRVSEEVGCVLSDGEVTRVLAVSRYRRSAIVASEKGIRDPFLPGERLKIVYSKEIISATNKSRCVMK